MKAKTLGCLFAAVMGLVNVARAETYSWTGAGDDNYWSTEKNWSGEVCPSSTDSIKPPVAPGEFTVDLENTTHTVSKLDFSSIYKSFAYPSIELRNGTLILSDGFDDPTGLDGSSYIDSGVMGENRTHPFNLVNATLKVQTKFMSGCPRTKGYMFTVGDGSSFILDHVNLHDKFSWVKILPGGTADFTFGTTVQKNGNSTCRSTWSNEGGTFSFPAGFTLNRTATAGWSKRASFRIQQKSGIMNLGGDVSLGNASGTEGNAMGLYFQWFGGTVHALSNVTFNVDARYKYSSSEEQKSFIESNSVVTAEVDASKTMDMSVLELRDGVSLTKTGAGALKLADVPQSLRLDAGSMIFSANTRTEMGLLKVGAGSSYMLVHSGMTIDTLEDNAGTIIIDQPGLSIGALGSNAALSGTFSFSVASFAEGDTIVTTPDATLRAKIKADAETAFAASGAGIIESGEALLVGTPTFIFDSTTVTDLNDPSGWQSGLPAAGSDVIVSGAGVNVLVSADLTNVWNSITVQNGASVRIAAAGLSLPPIVMRGDASLTVAVDFTPVSLATHAEGAAFPTLTVTDGATLTVSAGCKFTNVHLVLCDGATLTESGDGPLSFGYAAAGETTYFAMHATNATIAALNSANTVNASRIDFASPASCGTVVVVDDIVLKGCAVTYNSKDGFAFGYNNPTSQTFKVIADSTGLDFGAETYISGGANLVMTNGSVLCRRRQNEGDNDDSKYNLNVTGSGLLTLVAGGELRGGVTYVNGDLTKGAVYVTPEIAGTVGIEVLDGGIGCWYKGHGQNKGVIRFADGYMDCFKGYWWGWGNRAHIFNYMVGIDVPQGKTMTFRGVSDKMYSNDGRYNLTMMLESPFAGGGNIFVTNTWNGKLLMPVVMSGANSCTGRIEALQCKGTALAKVYFQNGANWAGTVVANGRMEIADAFTGATAVHNSPVAVTFGALDLQADFPVKVWKPDGEPMTNDTLNVGTYLNNGGALVPELATDGVEFSIGDSVVVGKIAKDGALPRVPAGWVAKKQAIDGDDANDNLILKRGTGLQVLVR